MSALAAEPDSPARALRRAFDATFAAAPETALELVDFVVLTVGGTSRAVRLAAIAGIHSDRPLTRCPGTIPEFLGLSALRGMLIPVYDLGLMLGLPAMNGTAIAVVRGAPLAFAFDALQRQVRVPAEAVLAAPAGSGPRPELIRLDGASMPTIDFDALRHRIVRHTASARDME